ncbi:MAG: KH domain-containing protein [Candidatus Gracilibacteria bacterium]|nr:KH domain-containing protein [Candidatus Gracilibacteria bacterium]MDD2909054.1 KH domain-containing protein [Candidatus Gracilibacteria bacterium]
MEAVEFLKFIVTSLVKTPQDVEVEIKEDEMGTLLLLKINKNDMGTVIGKGGKTIDAIRTVLRVYGSKTNARVNLKVVEE